MTIQQYIDSINQRYQLGNSTEHTFRGDLQHLIESLVPEVRATNEPKRQSCGAPDYILTKKDIPVGFIEAKDIGDHDLIGKKKSGNKEQFDRYKASLDNLIFTDYINFYLYHEGELVTNIAIAELDGNKIKALPENFEAFENIIKNFSVRISQSIKSPKRLAEMMAGKARLLSDIIGKALTSDEINEENSTLKDQKQAFKEILIHDITPKSFADVYAQTIAYGMFAARLHDPTLDNFSRQEAAELIPKSNPFLRKLFGYIAGPDIDDRIKWVVDSLTDIFLACNVEKILENYGKKTKMENPIIHFYETFLAEYDPKLRKAKGVWYTPEPVVDFIVRAVDDVLKTEFDLPQGLADTSKTKIKVNTQIPDKRSSTGYKQEEKEVHKVQVLDPATGTGTFLAEVVKHIHKKFEGQQGIWTQYVEKHLLPRLNGFELLMASYAMAHLQIDLLLKETGFQPQSNQRTRIYLTNSLEEYHQDTGTLFANWLSSEANEANHIKRDTPVMCVIGNPPYSGISSNNGKWISDLIEDYKYVDGVHFNERKHWLNDDYVKFLRYGQHFIEKNGSGVLAFINPHGFLDNPTFRGMRWNLLKTYDKIYTIDLHGNAKKKEVCPDGSPDQNVFDIMQGVAISIFIKTGKKKKKELGQILHHDLYGKREFKYDFLSGNSLKSIGFEKLKPNKPNYFFVDRNEEGREKYEKGFKIDELFLNNTSGIVSMGDAFIFDKNPKILLERINNFLENDYSEEQLRSRYKLGKNYAKWIIENKKEIAQIDLKPIKISYRPFDDYYTVFNNKLLWRWRYETMKHIEVNQNYTLLVPKAHKDMDFNHCFISTKITEAIFLSSKTGSNAMVLPLYLYPETNGQQTIEQSEERKPNFNHEIVNKIAEQLGLTFTNEKETTENTFAPIDILDYIYAVLHSPTYREKYKEFLKIDFPKVPYPKDQDTFWQFVKLGGEIRQIHLLESSTVEQYITQYPIDGDNVVSRKITKGSPGYVADNETHGKVYINDEQYFDNVPLTAWEFYIGGYQPAQKWLKDRKNRTLSFDDILHYQKIIVALSETDILMKEIDKIEI
ncbi:MAG: type ISP restriction/modification enzyme [Flavobacteriaceae bacterium]